MPYRNYINLTEKDLDRPIYRIMSVDRCLECLRNKQLTLVRPKKWDDPFENLLLRAKVKLPTGELGDMRSISNCVYGLCWTTHRETDAMWRIYSKTKDEVIDGVRVRTTPRKLLSALKAAHLTFGDVQCFIGRVKYQSKEDLLRSLTNLPWMESNASGLAESLMYKRREFSHESEVRLVHIANDGGVSPTDDFYRFPIDPNDLFEQAILDPRMERADYHKFSSQLKSEGFRNKIGQSMLYRPPNDLVITLS